MKSNVGLLFVCFLMVSSCIDKPYEELGNVFYKRDGDLCPSKKNHWLLDIRAKNNQDSVYLDSRQLGRKVEVHRLSVDTTSELIQLVSSICKGDSVLVKLRAIDFYTAFGGRVPMYLNDSDVIHSTIWMRDKLNDLEHIAFKKAFERDRIDRFVKNHRWNGVLDTTTMIYYEKLTVKKGEIERIKRAKISYMLKSLNGRVLFRTKEGEPLEYDEQDSGILPGIHFLVSKLSEGEGIRAVVPSTYAYGANGNKLVSGYTPVIMEINVANNIR